MNYKYVKKPVVTEAFQITSETVWDLQHWPAWLKNAWRQKEDVGALRVDPADENGRRFLCGTLEGALVVSMDDWIIQGVQGEIYPIKPDIFAATYEPFEPD